jgi:hypothetical protein
LEWVEVGDAAAAGGTGLRGYGGNRMSRCRSCRTKEDLSYHERPWPFRDLCLCKRCLRFFRLVLTAMV